MQIRWAHGAGVVAFVLAVVLATSTTLSAQISGRCKVVRMNDTVLIGEVTEIDGGYQIKDDKGITYRLKRNDVKSITPIDEDAAAENSKTARRTGGQKSENNTAPLSEDEINELLGDEDESLEKDSDVSTDALPDLPINQTSVDEMMRIAGRNAQLHATPHFALVYTSDKKLARQLASRLESTYRMCHQMMKNLDIPVKKPDYKLEIYFFGTYKEYESYGSINVPGGLPQGALGFYMRPTNRSAFFDLNETPELQQIREFLKQPGIDWRERQRFINRAKRQNDFFNLTVIQHEAAHHIHFNLGIFNRKGDHPRWLTEGLAQMFEVPPSRSGSGLGTVNNYRLFEFRQIYGKDPERLGDLRLFIVDDSQWRGGLSYSYGWALVHYLMRENKAKFAKFMQKQAQREDDVELSATDKQQEFEDIFGTVDDKFRKKFSDYVNNLQLKMSELPNAP